MAETDSVAVVHIDPPVIRRIETDQPWKWLIAGWEDMRNNMALSLGYGAVMAIVGYALTFGLYSIGWYYLILPLAGGFLIMGPVLATGLYEMSRERQLGNSVEFGDVISAFTRNPSQILLMGVALLVLFIFWARVAALLFMLYFGTEPPSFADLFRETFLSVSSIPFVVLGTAIGGVFAAAAFAISAISIPMLLDRPEQNAMMAMITSITAVRANWQAMALWAGLIGVFTAFGLVTLYIGLVVTLPLIGHATWHAYKDLVRAPA
ncbi:MAG: DUF2189 domain-containing protein [Geminicoccaceae bacterium]